MGIVGQNVATHLPGVATAWNKLGVLYRDRQWLNEAGAAYIESWQSAGSL
jgi:hypothetical protein